MKAVIGTYKDIAIKEKIFVYSDYLVCQTYKCKRKLSHFEIIKTNFRLYRYVGDFTNRNQTNS